MKGRKFKKLISIMLCLFTISFIIAASFINVSAATYFKVGNQVIFNTTDTSAYGEFGIFAASSTEGYNFVYSGSSFPDNFIDTYFDSWGFGISWHPVYSRNVLMAGTGVAVKFYLSAEQGEWYNNIKYKYGLDPIDFITVRVSSSSLANPNQWNNGTYFNSSTIVRPILLRVINESTSITDYKQTVFEIGFECPIEAASFIFEFQSAEPYGLVIADSSFPVKFGNIITKFGFKVSYIDMAVAELGESKGSLNDGIAQNNQLTSDLSGASDKVDEMIDKQAALAAMDPSMLDIGNVISSEKYSTLSIMLDDFWNSLGAELNFVLMFTLVVGLAIYLLGKKAKS